MKSRPRAHISPRIWSGWRETVLLLQATVTSLNQQNPISSPHPAAQLAGDVTPPLLGSGSCAQVLGCRGVQSHWGSLGPSRSEAFPCLHLCLSPSRKPCGDKPRAGVPCLRTPTSVPSTCPSLLPSSPVLGSLPLTTCPLPTQSSPSRAEQSCRKGRVCRELLTPSFLALPHPGTCEGKGRANQAPQLLQLPFGPEAAAGVLTTARPRKAGEEKQATWRRPTCIQVAAPYSCSLNRAC